MATPITVIIPVGPNPAYRKYLAECVRSIDAQMEEGDQIFFIDDQAHLSYADIADAFDPDNYSPSGTVSHWRTPWLSGCAHAWNYGVAMSGNEWNILMGSDDKLLPGCLAACREAINSPKYDPLGYYHLTCQIDNGEVSTAFNNAAMVSRSLWRETGGFPVIGAAGAPDALLISIMMIHHSNHLWQIREGEPLYWVRTHEDQETRGYAAKHSWELIQIRDKETRDWKKPAWTR